jgi:hypothetical protein
MFHLCHKSRWAKIQRIHLSSLITIGGRNIAPLFVKAIPLTLSTFWRYLLLLPFLAIGAFLFSLLTVIPIVGFFIPMIVNTALLILGLRCALAAHGYHNTLDNGKLLTFSFAFGVLFELFGQLLGIVSGAVIALAIEAGVEFDPLGLFVGLFGVSLYWSGLLLALLSPTALIIAVLAVPMTGAAHAMTYRGRYVRLFEGFGSGLLSLLFVLAVWLIAGNMYAIIGEIWTVFGLIVTAAWAFFEGEPIPWAITLEPWTALSSTLLMACASSWFFATAVLAWEARNQRAPAPRKPEHMTTNIRELRLARSNRGP